MPASLNAQGRRAASLVVLTLQNTALALLLHASRMQGTSYSAATAVLLNELLKGSISFGVAYKNCKPERENVLSVPAAVTSAAMSPSFSGTASRSRKQSDQIELRGADLARRLEGITASRRLSRLKSEIFSADCWKLSIPAILYVIQNNLQFVAAANLDVATFQITYQLKILTTAIFSVLLLRKRLTSAKWAALFFLAVGVAIVQLQFTAGASRATQHEMHRFTGFLAVMAACMTSGLAGVYFEMVLKGSTADLWVRNVQLSLFSLVPAFLPAFRPVLESGGDLSVMMAGFGGWAWSVVWCQVAGGLVTALVIKYSDNIVKGFATSLSIVLSFMASSMLFPDEFQITLSFLSGTAIVLAATYLYNSSPSDNSSAHDLALSAVPQSQREPLLPVTSRPNSMPSSPRRGSNAALTKIKEDGVVLAVSSRPDSPLMSPDLPADGRKRIARAEGQFASQ